MTLPQLFQVGISLVAGVAVAAAQWLPGTGSKANVVTATGYEAVLANPALLGKEGEPRFSLDYVHLGVGAGSNFVTGAEFSRYVLNRAYIDEPAKQELLGRLGNGPVRAGLRLRLQLLEAQVRSFGLVLCYETNRAVTLPRDFLDLAFWGNQVGRRYCLDSLRVDTIRYCRIGLGHGHQVWAGGPAKLRLGATAVWIHGFRYARADSVIGWVLTTPYEVSGELRQVRRIAKGGDGFSLTPGLTLELGRQGRIGIVIRDLWAPVYWHRNAGQQQNFILFDSFAVGRLIGGEATSTLLVKGKRFVPSSGFWEQLPAAAEFGAALTLPWVRVAGLAELPLRTWGFIESAPRFAGQIDVRPVSSTWLGIEVGWRQTDGLSCRFAVGRNIDSVELGFGVGLGGTRIAPLSTIVFDVGVGCSF